MSDAELSVVLVTDSDLAPLERTLEHLRRQTIREQLEVLVVGPLGSRPAEVEETQGFGRFGWIETPGPVVSLDRERARAVPSATAPAVAFIEDHAYPEPDWAEAVVAAHASGASGPSSDWTAVGAALVNANPRSFASWANLLTAYGAWTEPVPSGEVETLPGHNSSYRRDALEELAQEHDLGELMERGGGLHEELQRRGGRFYLEGAARVAHVNPSRWGSTVPLRLDAGRLYGAGRAASEGWSLPRRWLYALASPLIPLARLARLPEHQRRGVRRLAATAVGYGLDAVGQAVGYVAGAGRSLERLEAFEIDRFRHLTRGDRRMLGG